MNIFRKSQAQKQKQDGNQQQKNKYQQISSSTYKQHSSQYFPEKISNHLTELENQCERENIQLVNVIQLLSLYAELVEFYISNNNPKYLIYQKKINQLLLKKSTKSTFNLYIINHKYEKQQQGTEQPIINRQLSAFVQIQSEQLDKNEKIIEDKLNEQKSNIMKRINKRRTKKNNQITSQSEKSLLKKDGIKIQKQKKIQKKNMSIISEEENERSLSANNKQRKDAEITPINPQNNAIEIEVSDQRTLQIQQIQNKYQQEMQRLEIQLKNSDNYQLKNRLYKKLNDYMQAEISRLDY